MNVQDKYQVPDWRKKQLREKAIMIFELTKGLTPEQRQEAGNAFKSMEEMAGYVLELTN